MVLSQFSIPRIRLLSLICSAIVAVVLVSIYFNYLHEAQRLRINDDYKDYSSPQETARKDASERVEEVKERWHKQACPLPKQRLWPPEVKALINTKLDKLECLKGEPNWIYVQDGRFRVRSDITDRHGKVTCSLFPQKFVNDFQLMDVPVTHIKEGDYVPEEAFVATCRAADNARYSIAHSAIKHDPELQRRHQDIPLPKKALGLDVLMFGFDSTSRMNWLRLLPKSHQYFTSFLNGVVLKGYNILGDGTPAALLPILTGMTELEIPESRRSFPGASHMDNLPWIWKKLAEIGYVTQWGEDGANFGTFTFRMKGFQDKPVDHYLRPFYMMAQRYFEYHKPFCLGSMPRHKNMMNMVRDFFRMYRNKPKFSFMFHSELTHDYIDRLQHADDDLLQFLTLMETHGHLNNTLLILMADHGPRFTKQRRTAQGKVEERNPYVGIRLPPWFAQKHPHIAANLRSNAKRLTTPFDIHATFNDLLDFNPVTATGDVTKRRGISLFSPIPASRTCQQADVESHWCSCLTFHKIDTNGTIVQKAANAFVDKVNDLLNVVQGQCSKLVIKEVQTAAIYKLNRDLLRFKQSIDTDGRIPDLTANTNHSSFIYRLTVETSPGNGEFEVSVTRHVALSGEDIFLVDEQEISRTNAYGNAPNCVAETYPHLRSYCVCNDRSRVAPKS